MREDSRAPSARQRQGCKNITNVHPPRLRSHTAAPPRAGRWRPTTMGRLLASAGIALSAGRRRRHIDRRRCVFSPAYPPPRSSSALASSCGIDAGASKVPYHRQRLSAVVNSDPRRTRPGTSASFSGTWGNATGGPCETNGPRWSLGINWDTTNDGGLEPTDPNAQEVLFTLPCSPGTDPGPRNWGPETEPLIDTSSPCVTLYHAPQGNVQGNDIAATTCDVAASEDSTLTTEVHDPGHSNITDGSVTAGTVTAGTAVHDEATLDSAQFAFEAGAVHFDLFDNGG